MGLILLPCEVFTREFDAKLFLAANLAASYGHHVLIGYDKYFNKAIPFLRKSVLLDKSISSLMLNSRIKPCFKNGGKVIVSDEEGFNNIGIRGDNAFLARADPRAVDYIEKYACWGKRDYDFFSQIDGLKEKMEILGSPRSDLLSRLGSKYYEQKIYSLKSLFDPFVLVSDNFAIERVGASKLPRYDVSDDINNKIQSEYLEWVDVAKQLRVHFVDLLTFAVRNFTNINFIFRPHPASLPNFWYEKFGSYHNCVILNRDSVDPWIHAASAVITMGCTIGVQSIVAGRPTVEVSSSKLPMYGTAPRMISSHATDHESMYRLLSSAVFRQECLAYDKALLDDSWYNTNKSCSDIFADRIHSISSDLSEECVESNLSLLKPLKLNFNLSKWPFLPSVRSLNSSLQRISSIFGLEKSSLVKISQGVWLLSPPS